LQAEVAAQSLEQGSEEDQRSCENQRKEEEHQIWTRRVRLRVSLWEHVVEEGEQQKTRPWISQAVQGHWRTFRRRRLEEEHGTWVEEVKARVAAKEREMVASLVRHLS
jgi:uncharacterized membrane protein YheB (UPF0754 family)